MDAASAGNCASKRLVYVIAPNTASYSSPPGTPNLCLSSSRSAVRPPTIGRSPEKTTCRSGSPSSSNSNQCHSPDSGSKARRRCVTPEMLTAGDPRRGGATRARPQACRPRPVAPRRLEDFLPETIQVGVVQGSCPHLALGWLPPAPLAVLRAREQPQVPHSPPRSGLDRRGPSVRSHSTSRPTPGSPVSGSASSTSSRHRTRSPHSRQHSRVQPPTSVNDSILWLGPTSTWWAPGHHWKAFRPSARFKAEPLSSSGN